MARQDVLHRHHESGAGSSGQHRPELADHGQHRPYHRHGHADQLAAHCCRGSRSTPTASAARATRFAPCRPSRTAPTTSPGSERARIRSGSPIRPRPRTSRSGSTTSSPRGHRPRSRSPTGRRLRARTRCSTGPRASAAPCASTVLRNRTCSSSFWRTPTMLRTRTHPTTLTTCLGHIQLQRALSQGRHGQLLRRPVRGAVRFRTLVHLLQPEGVGASR